MRKILFFSPLYLLSFLLTSGQNCNNWLGLPAYPSFVAVGDLDVSGSQITVEGEFNMTQPYAGGPSLGADVVGKYANPTDVNYLLRAENAQITTSTGFYQTPEICDLQINKTYHVAMVYDGTTLKFYRNGFLMSQVPATGTLVQNSWLTQIGFYQYAFYNVNLIGYINEVRIWNVARTQAQIQAYMNTSLPSPSTQTGLLAYYTFDNLLNKQGNPAWNGTLGGSAVINQTNPTCAAFIADDECCPVLSGTISGNKICPGKTGSLTFHSTTPIKLPYTITYSDGTNTYVQNNVQDGAPFSVAVQPSATTIYTLLSIQGDLACPATPVSGQTATIKVDPVCDPCGNWLNLPGQPSYVQVGSLNVTGNQITVEAEINRTTPYATGTLQEGDVVSKHDNPGDVNYLLRPNHAYITTSDGFFGTPDICDIQLNKTYHIAMVYDGTTLKFYRDGFLMSQVPATGTLFQNAWATRIGLYFSQANNENFMGYVNEVRIWNVARTQGQIQAYMNTSLPSPATQTGLLAYYVFDDLLNKQGNPAWNGTLGGAAAFDQQNPVCMFVPINDCCPVLQGTLTGNSICPGKTGLLTFHSTSPVSSPPYSITYSDGTSSYTADNVQDAVPFAPAVQPVATTTYNLVSIKDAGNCAASSISGQTATILYTAAPKIQITADTSICAGTALTLQVSGANTYVWSPAQYLDNPFSANPMASPAGKTKFLVTATDNQLCTSKDSVTLSILPDVVFQEPDDATICLGDPVTMKSNNSTGYLYSWSPVEGLDNPSIAAPVASPSLTTRYLMHIEDPVCHGKADFPVTVTVNPLPLVKASSSNDIDCSNGTAQLQATGGETYSWSPAAGLNNPEISNPLAAIDSTTTFTVNAKDINGCSGSAFVKIVVTDHGRASLVLPNAFTPNADGINDCFGIRRWGNVTVNEFSIYNRWGQKVFETRNPSECWDGTFHGEMQDTGGYVYVIRAVSFCGNITRTGTLMLIR